MCHTHDFTVRAGLLLAACLWTGVADGAFIANDWTGLVPEQLDAGRVKAVQEAERPKPPKDNSPQPANWKILLTGSGGELGDTVQSYEIAVAGITRSGTFNQAPETGKPEKKIVKLSEAAVTKLWKVMTDVDAMNLADFAGKKGKDSPTYTIRLDVAGKKHAIHIEGYSQSEKHLKLILAVQKCFTEGVSP